MIMRRSLLWLQGLAVLLVHGTQELGPSGIAPKIYFLLDRYALFCPLYLEPRC